MNKRQFLSLATISIGTLVGTPAALASNTHRRQRQSIIRDDVKFSWRHHHNTLIGSLSAPTSGWLAVGFNELPGLRNTRFIIAVTSISPITAEEHLASVPDHKNVTELGLEPALQTAHGSYIDGRSHLEFQMSHKFADRPALSLAPGSRVQVMLAWSQATAFDHHSAWRKHFPLTL